jgi:hypothetical protein
MNSHHRHYVMWIMVAAAMLIGGPVLAYRIRPLAAIAAALGLGAISLIVPAHVWVVAAAIAPFLIWRRTRR